MGTSMANRNFTSLFASAVESCRLIAAFFIRINSASEFIAARLRAHLNVFARSAAWADRRTEVPRIPCRIGVEIVTSDFSLEFVPGGARI